MLRFLPQAPKIFRASFFTYSLMMFFFTLGDATMSYMAPVVMEHKLGATRMGLILATSSVVGVIMDFSFSRFFSHKKPSFFQKMLLSFAIFFPLSFLLYQSIPSFLFGMLVWGVYFEAMVFSNYHTIHETVQPGGHIWAWGMLTTVRNIGWVIGPLAASYLDGINSQYPIYFSMVGFALAIFLAFFFRKKHTKIISLSTIKKEKKKVNQRGFIQELRIWMVYTKVFWPVMFLLLMFGIIDSTFFSVGPVFAENLLALHPWGGLFIAMYTIPSLVFGVLAGYFARPFGKKRAAFGAGMLAGIGLIFLSRAQSVEMILATTFFASMGLALVYPEASAVFEDFVARSKNEGNDIVGLTALMGSTSYIIGPIINGYMSDQIGTQSLFGLWGAIISVFCLIMLLIGKRKFHVPQQEIVELLAVRKKRR